MACCRERRRSSEAYREPHWQRRLWSQTYLYHNASSQLFSLFKPLSHQASWDNSKYHFIRLLSEINTGTSPITADMVRAWPWRLFLGNVKAEQSRLHLPVFSIRCACRVASQVATCCVGDIRENGFDPWVRKIPWRRKLQPTPVFLPGKSHGQKILVGYSPWHHKRDTT